MTSHHASRTASSYDVGKELGEQQEFPLQKPPLQESPLQESPLQESPLQVLLHVVFFCSSFSQLKGQESPQAEELRFQEVLKLFLSSAPPPPTPGRAYAERSSIFPPFHLLRTFSFYFL